MGHTPLPRESLPERRVPISASQNRGICVTVKDLGEVASWQVIPEKSSPPSSRPRADNFLGDEFLEYAFPKMEMCLLSDPSYRSVQEAEQHLPRQSPTGGLKLPQHRARERRSSVGPQGRGRVEG